MLYDAYVNKKKSSLKHGASKFWQYVNSMNRTDKKSKIMQFGVMRTANETEQANLLGVSQHGTKYLFIFFGPALLLHESNVKFNENISFFRWSETVQNVDNGSRNSYNKRQPKRISQLLEFWYIACTKRRLLVSEPFQRT